MKRFKLVFLLLLITISSVFAMDIEIGNGTTTTKYLPFYGFYDYGWSNFNVDSNLSEFNLEINQTQLSLKQEPTTTENCKKEIIL